MSSAESQQQGPTAAIRDEVRRTIHQLNEMAQSEANFDQFCDVVLSKVVKITGAHGALLWQVNGNNTPRLTHQAGGHPSPLLQSVTAGENAQHTNAVMEVVSKEVSIGLTSEAFTSPGGDGPNAARDESFLMLFSPVYNRAKKCCGTLELLQRGDISPAAQEGYLRFLSQIAALFQRWHEQQDLARLTENAGDWNDKLDFITEVHRSIDPNETAFSIANETRRLLKCDRASVAKWTGSRCKIIAISSQDRFDNRANVVRKLGYVATSSVSADSQFWINGSTDGIAPDVAHQINDYLDEAHCRTLAVIPLMKRLPATPDLEMRSRRNQRPEKLGALIIEFFDSDVKQEQINDKFDLIVKQSELALENSQTHGEIFLLPVWQRLGWLQKFLFQDHFHKTMTGIGCAALIALLLIFFPKELKMKVDGVMHPTNRQTVFSQIQGNVVEIIPDGRKSVKQGELLLRLESSELELQKSEIQGNYDATGQQIKSTRAQLTNSAFVKEWEKINASLDQLEARKEGYENQLKVIDERLELLEITSPIAGTIISSQSQKRLPGFTVNPNYALFEIADFEGPWQLDLKIPQMKFGYVQTALQQNHGQPLKVEFRIGTNPNLVLDGLLYDVSERAIPSDSGDPVFPATVEADSLQFQQLNDELRSGVGVTAKIHCGKKSLGFVCFYQVYDWLRTKVFF